MKRRKLANLHSYFIFSIRSERLCGFLLFDVYNDIQVRLLFEGGFLFSLELLCDWKKKALDGDLLSSSLPSFLVSFRVQLRHSMTSIFSGAVV